MKLALAPARFLLKISPRSLAFLGLVAVASILCTVAALTIFNLQETRTRLDTLSRQTALGDAYGRLLVNIATAIGHSQQIDATGAAEHTALLGTAIADAFAARAEIVELGDASDRALMTALDERYGPEAAQISQFPGNPLPPNIDPTRADPFVLSDIAAILAAPTLAKRESSAAQLNALEESFNSRFIAIVIAFVVSVPLLGLLALLVLRYERIDAVRVKELETLGLAILTDGVTGLGNHRAFQEDLKRELVRASRTEGPLTVAMIDIDDFKVINDTSGHTRGDAVLLQLGQLMAYIRGEDRGYRVGGDEFALIMPDTDLADALPALDRLRESVRKAIDGVTISVGLSSNFGGEWNPVSLRDQADIALYEAKHRGKDQVVAYELELDQGNGVTAAKMSALRELVKAGRVTMVFQPILRIASGDILAFEALLRLPGTPEFSGPEEAFDIAQRMGRSRDLDLLCTAHALDAANDLPPGAKIFINLDPATLMHSDFSAGELLAMANGRNVDPADVVFEITEKTNAPLLRLANRVRELQSCGFGVALDDVGSGNSGLEMLRLMQFNFVKIDRSVVLDAMHGGPGRAVILAIVAFARETGTFMIAEGIENSAMLESIKFDEAGLRQFWVQGVQGFMFGEPRPSIGNYAGTTAAA